MGRSTCSTTPSSSSGWGFNPLPSSGCFNSSPPSSLPSSGRPSAAAVPPSSLGTVISALLLSSSFASAIFRPSHLHLFAIRTLLARTVVASTFWQSPRSSVSFPRQSRTASHPSPSGLGLGRSCLRSLKYFLSDSRCCLAVSVRPRRSFDLSLCTVIRSFFIMAEASTVLSASRSWQWRNSTSISLSWSTVESAPFFLGALALTNLAYRWKTSSSFWFLSRPM
mmetsp:Transcript_5728/g.13286  ORF Transcript_5728/g.13286 Transcript_5728/m.13286 type:complete len:223 (-) Transcript_5728:439-1107(-)